MVTPKGSMSTEGDTPSFCPTLQVLDICTVGDAADVNPVVKFLRHALQRVSLVLLESYLQTCMTYTIAERTVNRLLMMDRGTVRNM
jgi:hypothetical protein